MGVQDHTRPKAGIFTAQEDVSRNQGLLGLLKGSSVSPE